jgi:hypothetical protein
MMRNLSHNSRYSAESRTKYLTNVSLERYGNTNPLGGVASNEVIFIPHLVKICHLPQTVKGSKHRQRGNLVSLFFFLLKGESRMKRVYCLRLLTELFICEFLGSVFSRSIFAEF